MSEFPRYDRYPAAILADTLHLTLAEKGAYNVLLDTMWLQGARLPNDPKILGRIVRTSNLHWPRIWQALEGFFIISEDGKWITQKRMTQEFEKARARAEQAKENVNKRWGKEGENPPSTRTKVRHHSGLKSALNARNPLENNKQGHTEAYATRARAQSAVSSKDKNEALSKGASSYPGASDGPSGASSAREAERHAEWLHKLAERNRPADPNHPMLLQAEAEQIETYRRAKHLREKLKAAGFKGLRIIPP